MRKTLRLYRRSTHPKSTRRLDVHPAETLLAVRLGGVHLAFRSFGAPKATPPKDYGSAERIAVERDAALPLYRKTPETTKPYH